MLEYLDPKEGDPGALDLSICARNMTIKDWSLLLKAWGRWPFKPGVGANAEPNKPSLILNCYRCQCYLCLTPRLDRRFLWPLNLAAYMILYR